MRLPDTNSYFQLAERSTQRTLYINETIMETTSIKHKQIPKNKRSSCNPYALIAPSLQGKNILH